MQIGPYTVERELGRGGMGAVYLARESSGAPPLAIKVIHADLSLDEDAAIRFEREGAALERLDHPNLVALRRRGSHRGAHWLAMDFVQGESLDALLKRKGPWSSHAARELLISLCAGIAHAHQAGILHRDLKPANVLIRALDGRALIADFGLALPLDHSQHLTRTGEILGSPGFLAPEQCGLGLPTSPATDVYGLGALLYCVLTGHPPFRGASLLSMLDKVLNEAPEPPSRLAPNLDPDLEEICLRCLAKDPSERYPDALALQQALQAPPPPAPEGSRRAWSLALAGLVLAGLGLTLTWLGARAPSPAPSRASPTSTPAPSRASPTSPSTSPAPTFATPARVSSRTSSFEAALARRDWRGARAHLDPRPSLPALWQAYRLLASELSWTGEESPDWVAFKSRAFAVARELDLRGPDEALREGLMIALASLSDPRLGRFRVNDPQQASRALERALAAATEPYQRAALWRATTKLRLHNTLHEPSLEAIEGWERASGPTWETLLARCWAASQRNDSRALLSALHAGELASYDEDAPAWARYEFLGTRMRVTGRPTEANATLSESVLASQAPGTLKSRCAMTLATYLMLDAGKTERALEVLRDHPPHRRSDPSFRESFWQAHAAAALAAGDASLLRSLLEEPFARASGKYTRLLLRACAHALLLERDQAKQVCQATARPDEVAPIVLILELQTGLLLEDRTRTLAATQRLLERGDLDLILRAVEGLEAILELEAPGSDEKLVKDRALTREVGDAINAALRPRRRQLSLALLDAGRWEAAIELRLRLYDPKDPPVQDEQIFKTCYRALRRGLQEVSPRDPRWRRAQELVLGFVAHARGRKPRSVLSALLKSLEDLPADQEAALALTLGAACLTEPRWEELFMGHAMLRKRALMRNDPSTLHSRRSWVVRSLRAWAQAFPSSPEAHLEYVRHGRPPNTLSRLQELAPSAARDRALGWRLQLALALAQQEVGHLSEEEVRERYASILSSSGDPLRRSRRAALLQLAERCSADEDSAPEVRRILDWLIATTGQVDPSPDLEDGLIRGRYLLLRARVARELGAPAGALRICEELRPFAPETSSAFKAQAERLRAELEIQLGRPGGLERLRQSLAEHPTQSGFLSLARHTEGAARLEAYRRALCYGGAPSEVAELLREAARSGADPAELFERCLPILEEVEGAQPHAYAAALFSERREPARALLLLQALRGLELRSPKDASQFSAKHGALLAEAEAALPSEAQAIVRAQRALRVALERGDAKEIRRTYEVLQGAGVNALSDQLRVPLSLATALNHPSSGSQRERADRALNAYLARGTAPTLLRLWRSETCRKRGQLDLAAEAAEAGLTQLEDAPPSARSRFLLQAALNAMAAADAPRAEELLRATLTAETLPLEVVGAFLARAQLHLRRDELAYARESLKVAIEHCPPKQPGLEVQLALSSCRIDLLLGRLEPATTRLRETIADPRFSQAAPSLRAVARALEAAALSAEGAHERALELSEEALLLWERSPYPHLVRLDALVGLGRRDRAQEEAEALLDGTKLNPGDKTEIATWLERLRAGDR